MIEPDPARVDQAIQMAKAGPHKDEVTAEFLFYASTVQGLSDPLRDEFTFAAAWRAFSFGKRRGEESEQMRQVAEQLDAKQ